MKVSDVDYSNMIVGKQLTYNGKPITAKELLEKGYSMQEINRVLSQKVQPDFSYLQVGLVLQYYDGAWHGINVVVKINERFVWIKRWEDYINQKDSTPRRILKKKLAEEGYSTKYCGYSSEGSEYIGKIVEL